MDELMKELSEIQTAANLACDYKKTLALLRALKAGTVSLDNVTMMDDGWTAADIIVEEPAEPFEDPLDNPVMMSQEELA